MTWIHFHRGPEKPRNQDCIFVRVQKTENTTRNK